MYTRFNVLKHIVQNVITPNSYNRLVRFQSSATKILTNTYQDSKYRKNKKDFPLKKNFVF